MTTKTLLKSALITVLLFSACYATIVFTDTTPSADNVYEHISTLQSPLTVTELADLADKKNSEDLSRIRTEQRQQYWHNVQSTTGKAFVLTFCDWDNNGKPDYDNN